MSEVKAGNGAVVAFNSTDVKVTYSSGGTTIAQNGKTTPSIYIPITNPVSTSFKLDTIKVGFSGGGTGGAQKGQVTDIEVYYGPTSIYSSASSFSYTDTWIQTVPRTYKLADAFSYGILVTLDLKLPDSGSFITLYSVDLTFKWSSISFSVGLPLAYRVESLELPGLVHQIQADFEDGDHTFTSPDFKLGIVHTSGSRPLIGRLTFRYSYDAENRVITVCGTDYPSADGMTLITMPEGTDEACFEHAAATGFVADEVYRNITWNYHSQLMPGAAQVIKDIVRGASNALIAALEAAPQLIVQVHKTLSVLPMELYLKLRVVYRNGKFLEMYDQNREYEPHDQVRPVDSVFGGEVTMNYGENFANVIGSTSDPKIAGLSWLQLWANQIGINPTACTSLNYNGFICGSYLVGGHVISGQTARIVAKGSNSVYIFPICAGHNANDGIYMAALMYTKGVWLKDYLGP